MKRTIFLVVCLGITATVLAAENDNWPQLRGSRSLGIPEADSAKLPDTWTTTENVLWKTDLPGRGWSSPVVWGDKVFLSTVVNLGESEAPKKGLYFGGDRPKPSEAAHQWKVYCLDLKSGTVLWDRTAHEGPPQSSIHLKNSYASETPVTDGRRVYVYFGNVGLYCFDLDGKEIWSQKWTPHKTRLGWGTAASPVLYKDRLYVINDNEEESYLVCLDAATGEQIWRVERDEKSNWATPFIWENDLAHRNHHARHRQGAARTTSMATCCTNSAACPASRLPCLTPRTGCCTSAQAMSWTRKSRSWHQARARVGDISLADDQTSNEFIVWCQKDAAPYNPTSIIYKGLLYVLMDRGFLSCFDALTGETIYDKQRLPEGRPLPRRRGPITTRSSARMKTARHSSSRPDGNSRSCGPMIWPRTTCAWPRPRSSAISCCCAPRRGCIACKRDQARRGTGGGKIARPTGTLYPL